MKKDVFKRIALICSVIAVSGLFIYATKTNVEQIAHVDYPAQMNFAQEEVPTFMADVQERIDREMVTNINYHTNTTLVIKRANKVFPIIEPILEKMEFQTILNT